MNDPIGTENDLRGTKPRKQFKLKTKTGPLVVYAGGHFLVLFLNMGVHSTWVQL